jgi:hypothetical protein
MYKNTNNRGYCISSEGLSFTQVTGKRLLRWRKGPLVPFCLGGRGKLRTLNQFN